MSATARTATGLRLENVTWTYPQNCELCGETIPPGEPGVYGERRADPTSSDDDFEENYAWHLDCAQTLGELLLKVVAAASAEAR